MRLLLPADTLDFRDLSLHAIRRWRLVLVGGTALLVLGAAAWVFAPRLEEPLVDAPGMTLTIAYPGASPEDIEVQVVKPVEEALYDLNDVEWIEARSVPNAAVFTVRFADNANLDVLVESARNKVMGTKEDLPADVKDPIIVRWSTAKVPQMVVAVTGLLADRKLYDEAVRLKSVLIATAGIAGVDMRGAHKPAIRIRLDPFALARHQLSADDVARQLRLSNVRIPAGALDVGPLRPMLAVGQKLSTSTELAALPIGASLDAQGGARTVHLGDVADVRDSTRAAEEHFLYRGQPAVALEVRFRKGEDAVSVGRAVRQQLAAHRALLPPGASIVVCHDQPAWIGKSIRGFIESLLEGIALVMLITTLGMGWRAALVVSGVVPLSVGGGVLGLYLLGFSLETVTIGGLIVALGLLVDDAVIVTDSIQIMRDKGLSSLRAAVFGTARVFWANNGTTAVAVASFLPLFAMGGDIGVYIRGLPTAVVVCLVTSLVVAQLFTPWIATFLLVKPSTVPNIADGTPYDREQDHSGGWYGERNPLLRLLRRAYARITPQVVAHPGRVVTVFVLLLAGALSLFWVIGVQFFPKADKGVLFARVELPKGTRLELVADKLTAATDLIDRDPDVASTSAVVGGSYPGIFSSRLGRANDQNVGDVLVALKPDTDAVRVAMRLRQSLASFSGVRIGVDELSFGPPVAHPVFVRIFGDDHESLRTIAKETKDFLAEIPGVVNISDSLADSIPLARVDLEPERALPRGLTAAQVGQTLRLLYGEDKITEVRRGDELVDIVLEQAPAPDDPLETLADTPVRAATGALVPTKAAGHVLFAHDFAQLSRRNTRRVVEVWADLEGNLLASKVVDRLDTWLRARTWAPGYGFAYGGEQEETAKSFRQLGIAAFGALVLVFLLLLLLFDNLRLSLLVVAAVPFVLIGALPGLALTGNPFGFMAFLGLIALIGVYVNHKIYFVDRMVELMRRGEDMPSAIAHAGQDRLRPVVLTALTAVLGLVPLTLGEAHLWSSFGWVNIFGLILSIPLSLVFLPALILLTSPGRDRRTRAPSPHTT